MLTSTRSITRRSEDTAESSSERSTYRCAHRFPVTPRRSDEDAGGGGGFGDARLPVRGSQLHGGMVLWMSTDGSQALRLWRRLLDGAFRVPGTRLSFGWDPIIGLVPWAGDAVRRSFGSVMVLNASSY